VLASSRFTDSQQQSFRDEGAAAYTIWNRWIGSRGFDPAPVPRSLVQRRAWWQSTLASNSGTARRIGKRQGSNSGASNVGNGGKRQCQPPTGNPQRRIKKAGATEKGKSDCPCPCESQRIALASRLTAITLGCGGQRGHNLSHECAVLAVAPVSVPSAVQFGDKGGIEPTLATPANGFDQGNPVNPRDVVLVGNAPGATAGGTGGLSTSVFPHPG